MNNNKTINILLDLDETLICALLVEELGLPKWTDKDYYKASLFNVHNMDDEYIIFERPYLQQFLDFVFTYFNISVFSAGSQNYVIWIVDNIILKNHPERKIDYVFFSYHCQLSRNIYKCIGPKNMSLLWDIFALPGYTPFNTYIIDDNDEVCKENKENCIFILPFDYLDEGSEKDNQLLLLTSKISSSFL